MENKKLYGNISRYVWPILLMFQLLEPVEEAKKDYEQTKSEHDGLLAELASCI